MLNIFKQMMAVLKIKPNSSRTDLTKADYAQEDPRIQEIVNRVHDYLVKEHDNIVTKGMKPHSFDCEDNLLCTKEVCWVWQPDKIVSAPYVVSCEAADTKIKFDDYTHIQNCIQRSKGIKD